MKLITTILIFLCLNASGTIYYVSNAGSDAANGTSTGTSWQTISKVNSSVFVVGDQILFKKGDSWNERLNPPSSGSADNPITFGAYGTGVKPIITGFQTLSGFSNLGGNIWGVTASNAVSNLNTVLIDGVIKAKGRYPNYGYLPVTSSTTTQIVGALTGTPNYTGGYVAVRSQKWIIETTIITAQSGGTLTLSPALTAGNALAYFIQNIPSVLDTLGEWYFNTSTKDFQMYSVGSPTNVKISTIDTLVYVKNKEYITFDGIKFTGSNKAAIQKDSCNYIVIQNCSFDNNGTDAISGTVLHHISILKDSITNSLSGGIRYDPDNYSIIDSNYIYNTGMLPGMGGGGNGTYIGIYAFGNYDQGAGYGNYNTITNNKVFNTGYNGINFRGRNNLIQYNYVDSFCSVKDDGGGIYSFVGNGNPYYDTGTVVKNNIVTNGIGAPLLSGTDRVGCGIYLDEGSKLVTIQNNSISNTTYGSIYLHFTNFITVRGNTVSDTLADCLVIVGYYATPVNKNIKSNILYNRSSSFKCYSYADDGSNYNQLVSDSNYFLRPISEDTKIRGLGINYSLSGWQTASGMDLNGYNTPNTIGSIYGTMYYNATKVNSTITFSGVKVDAQGNVHFNHVTLLPFTSIILFPSSVSCIGKIGDFKFQ